MTHSSVAAIDAQVESAFREGYAQGWRASLEVAWSKRAQTARAIRLMLVDHWRGPLRRWAEGPCETWEAPPRLDG